MKYFSGLFWVCVVIFALAGVFFTVKYGYSYVTSKGESTATVSAVAADKKAAIDAASVAIRSALEKLAEESYKSGETDAKKAQSKLIEDLEKAVKQAKGEGGE